MTPVDYKNANLKNQIANVVNGVLKQYRFQSIKEFKAVLNQFNVTVEEVRGQAAGKSYQGLVYAATDNNGKRVGVGIKSSKVGRNVGLAALLRRIGFNKSWMKKHPPSPELKNIITNAIKTAPTKKEFIHTLQSKNIGAVIWQNDSGHIYGVTYIDHHSKCVFKGSALGKECSAGVINQRYNPGEKELYEPVWEQGGNSGSREVSLSEAILDLFSLESVPHPAIDDPEPGNPYGNKKKRKTKILQSL